MNKINFNQTGGFPLDTDILAFMQSSYDLFNTLGELAGNLSILKGCEVMGSNVTNGVVYIGGEILPFRGATISQRVVIKEEKRSLPFEDGENKELETIRYATFGNGTTTYNWADFKRIKNLQTINNKSFEDEDSLLKRLEKLEQRVTKTIPIGLVAIWDKPAEQIPEGWVEHTDLQGFTPVGQKLGDADFGRIGKTLGSKTHRLTINEIPRHSHHFRGRITRDDSGSGGDGHEYSTAEHFNISDAISHTGGDQPHNNIQPSRIVRFIRFIGFNN